MAKIFPWDVRIAVVVATIVVLVKVFDFGPGLFASLYVAVCLYVAFNTFHTKADP